MSDLEHVKDRAAELKISLKALESVGKPKRIHRSLQEALAEWRDKNLPISPELRQKLKPGVDDVDR